VETFGAARQATDGNTIWRMRFAFWISRATDTHSECVIIIAFSQTWDNESDTILRFLYIGCL
jgi:hypothetical protein